MFENNKKRNGIVTVCLWLGILGYLTITISYIVTMYSENVPNTVLGLGLCSMLALADALGLLLMMRWSKNGFYLLVLSSILSAVVNFSVLKLDLLPSAAFLIVSAIWFVILQLRSGGKSVWSQLKRGWDSKHCRHIYQMVAVIEVILFVLTLVAFGNCQEDKKVNPIQINESEKVEPQPQTSSHNQEPTKDTASIQESSPKAPISMELTPIESEKESNQKPEKPSTESVKDDKAAKDCMTKSPSYDLNAAVKYLDTHNIWNEAEMSKYADLKNLNRQLIVSIHIGHSSLPHELCRKSKRLHEIERMLREYEHLRITLKNNDGQSRIRFHGKESSIEVTELFRSIEEAIKIQRAIKRRKEIEKSVSDSIKDRAPKFA